MRIQSNPEEALRRYQRRMTPGGFAGVLESVAPPMRSPHASRVLETYESEVFEEDMPFVLPGTIYASTSPKYKLRLDAVLYEVVTSLNTAGSTSSTIHVLRNGTNVQTITVPSSSVEVITTVDPTVAFVTTDYIQVRVVTAGTGAEDLDTQLRFTG